MKNILLFALTVLFTLHISAQEYRTRIAPNRVINTAVPSVVVDLDLDGQYEFIFRRYTDFFRCLRDTSSPGQWLLPEAVSFGYQPTQFYRAVDLNNDGTRDIIYHDSFGRYAFIPITPDGLGEQVLIFNWTSFEPVDFTDFDGDGDIDLIFPHCWVENQENGLNWVHHNFEFYNNSIHIQGVMPDVNNDGLPDYLSFHKEDKELRVRLNTGGGIASDYEVLSFLPASFDNVFCVPGDFDGDGDQDIYVNAMENTMFFENDGAGVFTLHDVDDLVFTSDVLVTDYDGDNDSDILTRNEKDDALSLLWLENTGNAYFNLSPNVITEGFFQHAPQSSLALELVDFDNDGDPDIPFQTNNPGSLGWFNLKEDLMEVEDFEFVDIAPISLADEAAFIDLNNDGIKDIIFSQHFSTGNGKSALIAFENKGGFEFSSPEVLAWGDKRHGSLYVQDLTGNGSEDLICAGIQADNKELLWYYDDGTGIDYDNPIEIGTVGENGFIVFADFNGDGGIDIVSSPVYNPQETILQLFNNFTADNSQVNDIITFPAALKYIKAGDINGDQHQDLILGDSLHNISVYTGDGNGEFSEFTSFETPWYAPLEDLEVMDYDDDGDLDILSFGGTRVLFYENQDEGQVFIDSIIIEEINDYQGGDLETVDLDNDGDDDIVLRKKASTVMVFMNRREGKYEEFVFVDISNTSHRFDRFFDANGDGRKDFFSSTSSWTHSVAYNLIDIPTIKGICYYDENDNNIKDDEEIYLPSFKLKSNPDDYFSYTNHEGEFYFYNLNDEFSITAEANENWSLSTTPETFEIDEEIWLTDTMLYFGFNPNVDTLIAEVSIASAPTRCNMLVDFDLNYTNSGTITADGLLEFRIDSTTAFVSAIPAADSLDENTNTYYWIIENLSPTYSESVSVTLQMPDESFAPAVLEFYTAVFLWDEENQNLASDGTRYESTLLCSYDPNDKLVSPNRTTGYILPSDTLVYTIRFQNTGNDTAFTVRLTDYLDEKLDWSTCRPIAGSHDFHMQLNYETGLLEFIFDDIMLPDSTTDEQNSHGYAMYEIMMVEDLPDFSIIENTAEIYFDFNSAIVTNTTQNILILSSPYTDYEVTEPLCHADSNGSIEIQTIGAEPFTYFWNTGDTVSTLENLPAGDYSVTVTDVLGDEAILEFTLNQPEALVGEVESQAANGNTPSGSALILVTGGVPEYTYLWSTVPPQTTQEITGVLPGEYSVTVTDFAGCELTETVIVDLNSSISSRPQLPVRIIPNPTTGIFSLQSETTMHGYIELINNEGKSVLGEYYRSNEKADVRFLNLPPGVYTLRFTTEAGIFSGQVFLE